MWHLMKTPIITRKSTSHFYFQKCDTIFRPISYFPYLSGFSLKSACLTFVTLLRQKSVTAPKITRFCLYFIFFSRKRGARESPPAGIYAPYKRPPRDLFATILTSKNHRKRTCVRMKFAQNHVPTQKVWQKWDIGTKPEKSPKRLIYKGFCPVLTYLVSILVTLFNFKSVTGFWPIKRPTKAHQRASHGSKYSHQQTSKLAWHAPLRGCREHPQSNSACQYPQRSRKETRRRAACCSWFCGLSRLW